MNAAPNETRRKVVGPQRKIKGDESKEKINKINNHQTKDNDVKILNGWKFV